jgi:hypothetical protein
MHGIPFLKHFYRMLKKNKIGYMTLLFMVNLLQSMQAATYYITPGDTTKASNILQTIEEGISVLQPGDSLILREGAYYLSSPVIIEKSGSENQWITIMAPPGEKVILNGEAYRKEAQPQNFIRPDKEGLVTIQKSGYLRIENIGVKYSRSMGFCIQNAESHHIEIINCRSEGTYSCGIGIKNAEHIVIKGCEIVDANNLDYGPVWIKERPHEAPHEAISIMGAKYFEVANNHLHMCTKEGIDCKETSAYGIIHHNYVHDLYRQGIYLDAWFGRLHHVEVFENIVFNCEWGIVISCEGKDAWMDSVNMHHNIIYDNRASGIQFGEFGHNGKRQYINMYNNTLVNNGTPAHWSGLTGGIDIRSANVSHINVNYNVCMNNYGFPIALNESFFTPEENPGKHQIIIKNNVCFPNEEKAWEKSIFSRVILYQGEGNYYCKLDFTDAANKNFHLNKKDSCDPLKQGSLALGAYEYEGH